MQQPVPLRLRRRSGFAAKGNGASAENTRRLFLRSERKNKIFVLQNTKHGRNSVKIKTVPCTAGGLGIELDIIPAGEMKKGERKEVMALLRPGDFRITDRGVELSGLKEGDRILDIGCGRGDTVNHLSRDRKMKAEGIDLSLSAVGEAKERYPGINVRFGDGEFLDDYSSFTFDGVFMECV